MLSVTASSQRIAFVNVLFENRRYENRLGRSRRDVTSCSQARRCPGSVSEKTSSVGTTLPKLKQILRRLQSMRPLTMLLVQPFALRSLKSNLHRAVSVRIAELGDVAPFVIIGKTRTLATWIYH